MEEPQLCPAQTWFSSSPASGAPWEKLRVVTLYDLAARHLEPAENLHLDHCLSLCQLVASFYFPIQVSTGPLKMFPHGE